MIAHLPGSDADKGLRTRLLEMLSGWQLDLSRLRLTLLRKQGSDQALNLSRLWARAR